MYNLRSKIDQIEQEGPSIFERIYQFKPFGFQPIQALGFAMALVVCIGTSYLLFNIDTLPNIDLQKLSTQSQQSKNKPYQPKLVSPPNNNRDSFADSDSSTNIDIKNRYDNKIKLTGSN